MSVFSCIKMILVDTFTSASLRKALLEARVLWYQHSAKSNSFLSHGWNVSALVDVVSSSGIRSSWARMFDGGVVVSLFTTSRCWS